MSEPIEEVQDTVQRVERGEAFLDVRDLKVHFPTEDGLVKSVDGLSFHIERGRTLGIVGESGSGKSVSSLTVMGLTRSKISRITGEIHFGGKDITEEAPELEAAPISP